MVGESARYLNRTLLSALRKVEKKTRLRAEWASGKRIERFFDYVPKSAHRVILLRGINVGGKNTVPMVDLKKCLEEMGSSIRCLFFNQL